MKRKVFFAVAMATAGFVSAYGVPKLTAEQEAALGSSYVPMKRDKCQKQAQDVSGAALRAWGEANSQSESEAIEQARQDARTKIARQLEMVMQSLIADFNQQNAGSSEEGGEAKELPQGYVLSELAETPVICTSKDASGDAYQVYVCVELDEAATQAMLNKLSKGAKLDFDFVERRYRRVIEDMRP
jgi:hypothetical protein